MRREVDPDIYCPQAALVDEELNRKTQQRLEDIANAITNKESDTNKILC